MIRTSLAAALGAAAILGGCSAAAAGAPPSAVLATVSEFSLTLGAQRAAAGSVTFTVHNGGTIAHEFVVKKTTLASDQLPLGADGAVDEENPDVAKVDEVEDVVPGTDKTLTANLAPGHYVLICNLPGHYKAGMHADIEVVTSS